MLACLGTPDLITVLFFRCPGRLFTMKMQVQYIPYRQLTYYYLLSSDAPMQQY